MLTADGIPTFEFRPGDEGEGPAAREALAKTEWLLTDGLGGFAMGTVAGVMHRRYHGLLVASLQPPVRRLMALSALAESVVLDPGTDHEQRFDLACFNFRPGEMHPRGDVLIESFTKDVACHWVYRLGPIRLHKSLILVPGGSRCLVQYRAEPLLALEGGRRGLAAQTVRLHVRPLVAMRDFHSLRLRDTARDLFASVVDARTISVGSNEAELRLTSDTASASGEQQWWYNFQYDQERDRGYDYLEDLFHPGAFTVDWTRDPTSGQWVSPAKMTLSAAVQPARGVPGEWPVAADLHADFTSHLVAGRARIAKLAKQVMAKVDPAKAGADTTAIATLAAGADAFIVKRRPLGRDPRSTAGEAGAEMVSIIAGYPWFADWGRDAMIALPGLLLSTGRFDEAKNILLTFATHRGAQGSPHFGLVPNVFDDYTGEPHYNTVDASLWFIHAACRYLEATGDTATFNRELLPAAIEIVSAYSTGTGFGIGMDPADGLVFAGDASTQLTWMDAKRDGVVFTPRHGKAVEINALWYSGLRSLEAAAGTHRAGLRQQMKELAERVQAGFVAGFWDASRGYLADVLTPREDGFAADWRNRPNQLFACSLPFSPLSDAQRRAVTDHCVRTLATPFGVDTLDPRDPGFLGRYRGRMFDRDAAYHNGTAWPWLLGPMAEALLRSGGFSPEARSAARAVLAPIVADLGHGCLGQIAEVFDGQGTSDEPQHPAGCPAQAWSVAEALRVLLLVNT